MTGVISCPSCGLKVAIPAGASGKTVRCPKCGGKFAAGSPVASPIRGDNERPSKSPPPHHPDDDAADTSGLARRRRQRAARKNLILTWAVAVAGAGVLLVGGIVVLVAVGGRIKPDRSDEPVKWGKAATYGPLRVTVKSARMGGFTAYSPSGEPHHSSGASLLIQLQIENTDRTKNAVAGAATPRARLKDNFGNDIPRVWLKTDFGFKCRTGGQLDGRVDVRADEPVTDLLTFDRPVPAATLLTLQLDAAVYGGTGDVVFEIPESAWNPDKKT